MTGWQIGLLIAGSTGFFVVLWLAITWLIGRMSRWSLLAAEFPSVRQPEGTVFRRRTMVSRTARFKNVVTFTAARDGLDARLMVLFALGNRPWRVPWQHITARDVDQRMTRVEIATSRGPIELWIPTEVWAARPGAVDHAS